MSESWTTTPRVTQFDDADITALMALRKKYAAAYEQKGVRLTLTSFALPIVADMLKKHPIFNASVDEVAGQVVFKQYYHIGVAVDTEAGLIVPVIRDVDKKSVLELSRELEDLAKRARERKVTTEELKGGTFTISNQGGHWRGALHSHCEQTRGGDPGPGPWGDASGRARQCDRAAPADADRPLLRSPGN